MASALVRQAPNFVLGVEIAISVVLFVFFAGAGALIAFGGPGAGYWTRFALVVHGPILLVAFATAAFAGYFAIPQASSWVRSVTLFATYFAVYSILGPLLAISFDSEVVLVLAIMVNLLGLVAMYLMAQAAIAAKGGPPDPSSFLDDITREALDRKSRAKKRYVIYWECGRPGNDQSHRAAYDRALKDLSRKPVVSGDLKGFEKWLSRVSLKRVRQPSNRPNHYPVTAYVNITLGSGPYSEVVAIQYWLAYFYNHWENNHEMDWEQVTVYVWRATLDATPKPLACALSSHAGGTLLNWNDVEHAHWNGKSTNHPAVFVARGSHANYSKPGWHPTHMRIGGLRFTGRELGALRRGSRNGYVDRTLDWEQGQKILPEVVLFLEPESPARESAESIWGQCPKAEDCETEEPPDCERDRSGMCRNDFRWLNLKGKWGYPGAILGDAAPVSPPCQPSWDLFRWLDEGYCEAFDPAGSTERRVLLAWLMKLHAQSERQG